MNPDLSADDRRLIGGAQAVLARATPQLFAVGRPGPAGGGCYLNDRAATIYGGSNEIQRDIIAKLVLGL